MRAGAILLLGLTALAALGIWSGREKRGASVRGREPVRTSGPAPSLATAPSTNLLAHESTPCASPAPADSIRIIAAQPANADRDARLRDLFARFAASDLERAFDLAAALAGSLNESMCSDLYGILADAAVSQGRAGHVLQLLAKVPHKDYQWTLLERAVLTWASREGTQAGAWILALPPSLARDQLLRALAQQASASSPAQGLQLAREIGDSGLRRTVVTEAWLGWFETNPSASTQWLSELPPHADLDAASASVAALLARVPARAELAVGWAESISDHRQRETTLEHVVHAWSETDRPAAARYTAASPHFSEIKRQNLLRRIAVAAPKANTPAGAAP